MLAPAIRRLAKGSVVYGLGSVLQRCMSVLLLPLFTRYLSTEDFGIVALISVLGVLLSGTLTLGTGNSLGVVYYREQGQERRATVLWTNTILLIVNCSFGLGSHTYLQIRQAR